MGGNDYSAATLWGIHGGKLGDADYIFRKKNQVALGWEHMGDLKGLSSSRDAFRDLMLEKYPDKKPGYYPVAAGQLYRFVHEMKNGDLIVYPSRIDKHVHIGEIVGDYKFEEKSNEVYPHRRAVKWLNEFPRTRFSQGALFEIGSAMTLFQVKNYSDEFFAALSGTSPAPIAGEDVTVAYVAEDIEQNTRDFIFKTMAHELKGHALADFVAQLLGTMGYRTRVSPPGPDGGIDIVAHKDELGFVPPIIKVQVKSTEGSVGDPVVSQLIGKLDNGEYGMVVTLGSFTSQAKSTAQNRSNLRLVNGDELVDMVLQHYEDLDSKYKGMMPLKSVYVPEPLDDNE